MNLEELKDEVYKRHELDKGGTKYFDIKTSFGDENGVTRVLCWEQDISLFPKEINAPGHSKAVKDNNWIAYPLMVLFIVGFGYGFTELTLKRIYPESSKIFIETAANSVALLIIIGLLLRFLIRLYKTFLIPPKTSFLFMMWIEGDVYALFNTYSIFGKNVKNKIRLVDIANILVRDGEWFGFDNSKNIFFVTVSGKAGDEFTILSLQESTRVIADEYRNLFMNKIIAKRTEHINNFTPKIEESSLGVDEDDYL